ncbi:hypothetical protein M0R45_015434 [Rubus argutus]|uniref:Uncharacterized protein n=1 Tax=Rubus argutus TaxID=59490 RepID=A0AAW1XPI5_RUBAR
MGNVQTYILWESQRALKDQEEKVKDKYRALKSWLTIHGISEKTKTQVEEIIKQNKEVERKHGDVAVDLVFVFNAIKEDNNKKWEFWTRLCENALKNVTILQHLPMDTLGELLVVLHPVRYSKDDYVVHKEI